MMCLGFRNALELAVEIIEQVGTSGQGGANGQLAQQQMGGSAGGVLQAAMQHEQMQMVRDALETFGHAQRRATLPLGTVADCMA